MSRGHRRAHSLFDSNISTARIVDRKQKRPNRNAFPLPNVSQRSTTPQQHSNDSTWDLSVRESLRRQKDVNIAPSAAPKAAESPDIKKNVAPNAPVASLPSKVPATKAPSTAPSPGPSTFFTAPTTPVPIPPPPTVSPSQQPIKRITPTVAPARSTMAPFPIAQPLSPPSQEASNAVSSPDTTMPPGNSHGPVTLMTLLGAALASLVLSVLVLRARHRYVQKHGAASTRRRQQRESLSTTEKPAVPTGIEVHGSTLDTREGLDVDGESL